MLLEKIRIQSFRQYDDVTIPFERGLTAIVGPNGAGKSTLVEAIIFALYGEQRGNKDTLRPFRLGQGEPSVTLWFQLGEDHFRVHRTLSKASLHLVTDVEEVLAQSLSGVTSEVQRRLGLTHEQFVNSFYTEQKNAHFLKFSSKGRKVEELAKMLGYDDLKRASKIAERAYDAARSELAGLQEAAQTQQDAKQRREIAAARLEQEKKNLEQLEQDAERLLNSLKESKPKAERAKKVEECVAALERIAASIAVAEQHVAERKRELEEAKKQVERRASLEEKAREYEATKKRLQELEALRSKAAEIALARRQLEQLAEEIHALQEELSGVEGEELERVQTELKEDEERLAQLRTTLEEQRRKWQEQGEAVRREVAQLEADAKRLRQRLEELKAAAKDGVCVTCGQPLPEGRLPEQDAVEERLVETEANLERSRAEARAFEAEPESFAELRAEMESLQETIKGKEAALAVARDRAQKAAKLRAQLGQKQKEVEPLQEQCAEEVPFDQAEYEQAKQHLAALEEVYRDYLALASAEKVLQEAADRLAREEQRLNEQTEERKRYQQEIEETGLTLEEARAILQEFQQAEVEARTLVERIEGQKRVVQSAERELAEAVEATKRYEDLLRKIEERARAVSLNRTVQRAMEALSKQMTDEIRPELQRYASDYVAELSRGRYRKIQLNEDFVPHLVDDVKGTEQVKQVISGGEEDLMQLSLRLALSHFIRSNANQSLSLLILDEVFGSLDEDRRSAVLDQLRALSDLFEQVLIISHIDAINEAADRVIEVRYDAEAQVSRVTGTDIPDEELVLTAG